jgi:hypothetical protein
LKVAVTVTSFSIVIAQLAAVVESQPPQVAKLEAELAAAAVSVKFVPVSNCMLHEFGDAQFTPFPVTVPRPFPAKTTVRTGLAPPPPPPPPLLTPAQDSNHIIAKHTAKQLTTPGLTLLICLHARTPIAIPTRGSHKAAGERLALAADRNFILLEEVEMLITTSTAEFPGVTVADGLKLH